MTDLTSTAGQLPLSELRADDAQRISFKKLHRCNPPISKRSCMTSNTLEAVETSRQLTSGLEYSPASEGESLGALGGMDGYVCQRPRFRHNGTGIYEAEESKSD